MRKINVRAEIETFDRDDDRAEPNLITGVEEPRNDRVARIRIPVTLATNVDPEKVRDHDRRGAGSRKGFEDPAPATMFVAIESAG